MKRAETKNREDGKRGYDDSEGLTIAVGNPTDLLYSTLSAILLVSNSVEVSGHIPISSLPRCSLRLPPIRQGPAKNSSPKTPPDHLIAER